MCNEEAGKNIFVSIDDVCVQKDADGLYHIHVGQQGLTGVTMSQIDDLSVALRAALGAYIESEEI